MKVGPLACDVQLQVGTVMVMASGMVAETTLEFTLRAPRAPLTSSRILSLQQAQKRRCFLIGSDAGLPRNFPVHLRRRFGIHLFFRHVRMSPQFCMLSWLLHLFTRQTSQTGR